MNIIFFAHFAGSPKHGMVYGHYYLAREWMRAGHDVTIVAASFAHTRFLQPQSGHALVEEFIDGIRYLWIPTPSYSPVGRLGRVRNILTFALRCWLGRLPIERADLVICSSHHPFAIHAAHRLARRHGARLVFEVRDLWPLTLIELGGADARHPFIRAMQWSENYAYRHADRVVSVLVAAHDYMVEHGMASENFLFVPNGVDMDEKQDRESLSTQHMEALERARVQGRFIVGYAGRVGLANALYTLVDALALCPDQNVCAAILGGGSHVPELYAQAERLGLVDRVLFLDSVPKAQVNDFLARVDVAYIGLQNQPLFRFGVSPTKLNDYMLAAKPIICAIDAPGDIVAESGAGVSCRAEDPEALSVAIQALRGLSPAQRAEMGECGRRWIVANRDYRVLAQRFLDGVTAASSAGSGR